MEHTASQDSLNKAFAGSLVTHGVVVALFLTSGLWNIQHHFGDTHVSSGSVGVDVVKSIPIPRPDAPVNPVANDTKAIVPPAPAVKQVEKVQTPPDAIPLSTSKPKKLSKQDEAKMLFRPPVEYKTNQLYSRAPAAASSPMFGKQGSSGIDVGEASVLGERFGAYVDLMRDRISQHWNRSGVTASPSERCLVSFTVARNGTITDVKIAQPSGNYVLDTSAKRAILDASPLPELPAQFDKNSAQVDLWFQLR